MLRNGEDYDLEPEDGKEDRPDSHTRKHANIRGRSYFVNKPDNQSDNNQNKEDNEDR